MRKMMNKKGFSLVELMIVVVIMGILIAVAIPLYGAITDNANNKTCANNIKVIKNTCSNYYASSDPQAAMPTWAQLASMMESEEVPQCPVGTTDYAIHVEKDGRATVICPNLNTTVAANDFHTVEKTGSDTTAPTTDGTVQLTKS